jgi:hypothetical protein
MIFSTNADVARAEAQAYRNSCGCVFAVLIRATPRVLTLLALQAEVRVVDPAPEIDQPGDAVFSPLYPEQVDRVEPPPDESLTSPN